MRELLEALLDLQNLDVELAGLEAVRSRLPRKIAELAAEKESLRAAVAQSEERLAAARGDIARRQRDLEGLNAKRDDLVSRQLIIKTNEEYAALTHEIGFAKQEIRENEDALLRLMEDAERLVAELEKARVDLERSTRDIDGRTAGFERELAELSDAVAVKRDERLRVSKRVDRPILSRYERILASKGNSAIADVTDGTCSGCRMKLPPQTVIEVRSGRRLMVCESCGRILFWQGERGRG